MSGENAKEKFAKNLYSEEFLKYAVFLQELKSDIKSINE